MKRPKIDIFDFEEASDLSRAVCDEPMTWDEPSKLSIAWGWIKGFSSKIWGFVRTNWIRAYGHD